MAVFLKMDGAASTGDVSADLQNASRLLSFEYHAGASPAGGDKRSGPITFVKEVDAASANLYQALVKSTALPSVVFEFVRIRPAPDDDLVIYQTITLTNAKVAELTQSVGTGLPGDASTHIETISFTFDKIDLTTP
jgi:type VI secretion system Hcp family effector